MIDPLELWGRGTLALNGIPWRKEVRSILAASVEFNSTQRCLLFDILVSLAYADATSNLTGKVCYCKHAPANFNAHAGFINMCSPCFTAGKRTWQFQKAAKPKSGVIGRVTSELILTFFDVFADSVESVRSIGGTDVADFALKMTNGEFIVGEIKSAPLLTFPILFEAIENANGLEAHGSVEATNSQFNEMPTALYLHNNQYVDLGEYNSKGWPFKGFESQFGNFVSSGLFSEVHENWLSARDAYSQRNREDSWYYLANAAGSPPRSESSRDGWPKKESISDSKTSVGIDRTDDIKKGIYQVLKLGTQIRRSGDVQILTALLSNLPALRHHGDYLAPVSDIIWAYDSDLDSEDGVDVSYEKATPDSTVKKSKTRRLFDYLLTLDDPILRDLKL
ncbi:hypothetical protein OAU50_04485 [Planctomycetota bacterium]|nr:hypothetical protein [Planctomycetota bacterium]